MRLRRHLVGLAAATATTGLLLAACATEDTPEAGSPSWDNCDADPVTCNEGEATQGGELTWLINQGWDSTWNRMTSAGNTSYLNQALQGTYVRIGYFAPDGAWTWDEDALVQEPEVTSEDPLTIVYEMREEAVWNDGTPIGIDDWLYAWKVYAGDESMCVGCTPPGTTGWDSLQSITADASGKVITVTYEEGVNDAEWFARFAPNDYPAHIAEEAGFDLDDPEQVGASMEYFTETVPFWSGGPMLIESAVVDESVEMVPNPNWYGENQPTMDRITKVVISDQGSWFPAIQNEELEGGWPASFTPDFAEQLDTAEGIMWTTGSAGAIWEHVDMNTESVPVELRQAIFTAINREHALTSIWGDISTPVRNNQIFPQLSPYYSDAMEGTGYGSADVEAARGILETAGYTGTDGGAGALMDPEGEEVGTLRFAFLSGNENRATFTELAQAYLAEIGLDIEPAPTPAEQLGTVLTGADYDLVIFGWVGSPLFTGAPHQFYHSESTSNFGLLNNPQIDTIVEQIRDQSTVEDASALVNNELMPLLMDEAYVLPLWDQPQLSFVRNDMVNIRPNYNSQLNPLYNIGDWGVAAAS